LISIKLHWLQRSKKAIRMKYIEIIMSNKPGMTGWRSTALIDLHLSKPELKLFSLACTQKWIYLFRVRRSSRVIVASKTFF
jgi:hypothetical protein